MLARYHDETIFQRTAPSEPSDALLFRRFESVRCLYLGANLYVGIRKTADEVCPGASSATAVFWRILSGERTACLSMGITPEVHQKLLVASTDQERFSAEIIPLLKCFAQAGSGDETDALPAEDADQRVPEFISNSGEADTLSPIPSSATGWSKYVLRELSRDYAVFDAAEDRVVHPGSLISDTDYSEYRRRITALLQDRGRMMNRLVQRLQRHLQSRQQTRWVPVEDGGHLDTARLASWIAQPLSLVPRRREEKGSFSASAVTLLLDLSGSMRGGPILNAACCAELVSGVLERCHIPFEVLGYTTRFSHEHAIRRWRERGRPQLPGRLNGVQHVVFKDARMPWRRMRRNLAWIVQAERMGENIDGEAVQWAALRLLRRPEERKILIVVSDGSPYDEATAQANGRDYLERHLKAVATRLEETRGFTLMGIGLGRDLNRFFTKSAIIRSADDIVPVLTDRIGELLAQT